MKVVVALTAGLVLALAPAGSAFAGERPVPGKAFGNCKNSSSGGDTVHEGLAGNGNGGMVTLAKETDGTCVVEDDSAVVEGTTPAPPAHIWIDG
jgi:hypothetical protein